MKKIMFGVVALISLSVSASALLMNSKIDGVEVISNNDCDQGYILVNTREGVNKAVCYNSCEHSGIKVVALENAADCSGEDLSEEDLSGGGSLVGETVNINGVDYYFPSGYTVPTVAADNTCEGGYNNTDDHILCYSSSLTSLSEGWLNLTSGKEGFTFSLEFNQLTNIDNLANLTSLGDGLYLNWNNLTNLDGLANLTYSASSLAFAENQITNVDGLANLTYVGNSLILGENQITNVDGLAKLTTVGGHLNLGYNKLTNVNGLSKLDSVGLNISFSSNPDLQNLSGLSNLKSLGGVLYLEDRDYTIKIDSNSYLCQNFDTKVVFYKSSTYETLPVSDKSYVCAP